MDFSKLSNEELMAMKPQQDFSQMSNEELMAMKPQQPQEEVVLNEQYEPIQGVDRALIKNTKGDNQGIMNYLHEKHKNSEFRMEGDSVQGRDRGTKEWRKMDVDSSVLSPSTWELQDLSDVGTDIAGGVAEGAAALAAGTAGMVGTPLGAIAAGSAAAGATATGVDLVKQGAAKFLGLREEEIDSVDALKEGAISAATTPLFGIGGAGKIANKVAGMGLEGVEKAAALKLAQRAEEGLITSAIKGAARGAKSGSQTVASMASGVAKKDFQTYFKNFDELENMDIDGAMELSDGLFNSLYEGVNNSRKEVADMYDALKGTGKNIEMSDTIQAFNTKKMDIISKARESYRGNPKKIKQVVSEIENFESEVLGSMARNGRGDIGLETAMNMEQSVKDFFLDPKRAKTAMDKGNAIRINELVDIVSKGTTHNIDTALSGTKYSQIKKRWKEATELAKTVKGIAKDEAAMYGNLLGIDTKAGIKKYKIEHLKKITENFGIPYEETARKLRAYTFLKDPSWMPTSGTATSTSRSLFGGGVGGALGFALGGGNPMTAAAGAAAGSIMGSPASMKGIGKVGRSVGNNLQGLGRKVPQLDPRLGNAGQRAVWQSINNRDR